MKNLLSLISIAALLIVATPAAKAQTYVRSSTGESLAGYTVLGATTTNIALNAHQIGWGGNSTVSFFTTISNTVGLGTSNVIFTFKTGTKQDIYADTTIKVTNTLSGTTAVNTHNVITVPAQTRYIQLYSVQTVAVTNTVISAWFGQHRP